MFVEGQGVGYDIERDGLDDQAVHAVVELEGQIVGAGRMVPQASEDGGTVARIGRMAVLLGHRRQGMATAVLRALEEEARSEAGPASSCTRNRTSSDCTPAPVTG